VPEGRLAGRHAIDGAAHPGRHHVGLRRRHPLEGGEQRVDEAVADLGEVVQPVVEAPAVRGRGVEHRLQCDVRHRADEVEGRRAGAQRAQDTLALGRVAAPGHGDRDDRPPLQRRRERRLGRCGDQRREERQVLRRRDHQLTARPQRVAGVLPREDEHPADDHRADAVRAELEARDGGEVAAAAAQRPEQVGALVRARADQPPVGEDDLGGQQGIDGQPVAAHEPAEAAAQRQPADARVGDLARGHREAVLLGRRVELSEQRAAAHPHDLAPGIHVDAVEPADVDAERAVTHRAPGDRVTAGPDREGEGDRSRGADGGADVVGVGGVGDGRGTAVDRAVPAGAGGVIAGVVRLDDAARETLGSQPRDEM
jgi:hypothetical protein